MAFNVNTDLVKGEDLFLYVTSANTVLAFATSCALQIDGETIDTSNKMSCRWNANLAGKNSYTVTADALYAKGSGQYSFDDLMEAMVAGEAIAWTIGYATEAATDETCETRTFALDSSKTHYTGKGIVTSLSLNAGNNEVASCSITITGSGEIEIK